LIFLNSRPKSLAGGSAGAARNSRQQLNVDALTFRHAPAALASCDHFRAFLLRLGKAFGVRSCIDRSTVGEYSATLCADCYSGTCELRMGKQGAAQ
jgi:hypothetical protein